MKCSGMNGPVKTVLRSRRRQHHPHERVDADHGEHGQRAEAADAARGEAPHADRPRVPRGRPGGGTSTEPTAQVIHLLFWPVRPATRSEPSDIGASTEADLCRDGGEAEDEDHRAQRRAVAEVGQSGLAKARRGVRAEHLRGVDGPPSVITQMTSNSLMPLSRLSVMTSSVTGRSIGTVTDRSCCHPLAPSTRRPRTASGRCSAARRSR